MDDLEFVRHCVNDDVGYWDEFVDRYSRLIYSGIHSVLRLKRRTSFPRDPANDLFHEIFLSLRENNFKKLRSFKARNGCSLATWLRQVAINHTHDYARKMKVTVSLDEENASGLSLKDIIPDSAVSQAEILVDKEKAAHLKECVEQLDTDAKYFLELIFGRDLRLKELKDVLGVSRGAIDMRKARIMDQLRECFRTKGYTVA